MQPMRMLVQERANNRKWHAVRKRACICYPLRASSLSALASRSPRLRLKDAFIRIRRKCPMNTHGSENESVRCEGLGRLQSALPWRQKMNTAGLE